MKKDSHVNVTIDFTNWGGSLYDLRIPIQLYFENETGDIIVTIKRERF